MTICVISDVHLGHENCNIQALGEFLNKYKFEDIDHLVLLGDIFDLWERYLGQILAENDNIIERISNLNVDEIHYIVGNHDYYMLDLYKEYAENIPYKVCKSLRIQEDGNKFYFIHGHEPDVILNLNQLNIDLYNELCKKMCLGEYSEDGILKNLLKLSKGVSQSQFSSIESNLSKFLNKKTEADNLVKEIMNVPDKRRICKIYKFIDSYASLLIGRKPDEKLVFGHTHNSFINKEKTFINVGSWTSDESRKTFNNFLEIYDGNIELKFFKN